MEATDFTVLMELMTLTELVDLSDLEGLVELMGWKQPNHRTGSLKVTCR